MRGGKREGSGRKPKADEVKLIETLDNKIDRSFVFDKLRSLIEKGNMRAIEVYLGYRFGKPKESMDMSLIDQEPITFILPKDFN